MSAIISWSLPGVLVRALHHRITAWPRFVAALQAYRLLPPSFAPVAAAGLVILEIAAVVLLGFLQPSGLWLAAMLFAGYLLAMAINLLRGRTSIDCGCGDEPTLISVGLFEAQRLGVASIQDYLNPVKDEPVLHYDAAKK